MYKQSNAPSSLCCLYVRVKHAYGNRCASVALYIIKIAN